jgi:endonuclease/exonuclease/phosphatase family metal-dependent hydrolase
LGILPKADQRRCSELLGRMPKPLPESQNTLLAIAPHKTGARADAHEEHSRSRRGFDVIVYPPMLRELLFVSAMLWVFAGTILAQTNSTFVIGTYNVENWNSIERNKKPDQPKPQNEKEAVVAVITSVRPDVLGIEEMGSQNDFAELRAMLSSNGLDYAHWEWVAGADPDRHVCLLSRFPITSRKPHTTDTYMLDGRPTPVGRGFLDVVVKVNDRYSFRAIVVHLKSKRQTESGDQAVMRLAEARLLRGHLDKVFKRDPHANLIAMGDFNDTPDADPIQLVIGKLPFELFPLPCTTKNGYEGTHFWRGKKEWSRIDYLMASPGMSNEFVAGTAQIHEGETAFDASDHRMIYANFHDRDIGPAPLRSTDKAAWLIPAGWIINVLLLITIIVILAIFIYTRRKSRP